LTIAAICVYCIVCGAIFAVLRYSLRHPCHQEPRKTLPDPHYEYCRLYNCFDTFHIESRPYAETFELMKWPVKESRYVAQSLFS
jgi:hypothetical protein